MESGRCVNTGEFPFIYFSHFAAPSVKTTTTPKTTTAKNKESDKNSKDVNKTDRINNKNSLTTRAVTNITQKANKNTKMVSNTSQKVVNSTTRKISTTPEVAEKNTSKGLEENKTNMANSTEVTGKPGERIVAGVNLVETDSAVFSKNLKTNCVATKSRPSFVIW